jgi:serine/threonine protein phosphatase PrpC
MNLRLTWSRISDIGGRDANQDALGEAVHANVACFVLADGAGGHAGGQLAARLVVDAVLAQFAAQPVCNPNSLLAFSRRACDAVARGRATTPEYRDMSATLAAVLVDCASARVHWGHLGDSRVYLFRDGRVHAVTTDHSVTQQFIDAGFAKADQLRLHPQRNILYAAIGADGEMTPALSHPDLQLRPRDALLVCSDGLWEWVLEDEMLATLRESRDSEMWLAALCDLAHVRHTTSRKVRDNFSAFTIFVSGEPA